MSDTLSIARGYLAAGLGVLPIRADGSKAPDLPEGHPFLRQRPTDANLVRWFGRGGRGIGVPCGAVSGHLETLDFERRDTWELWCALVEEQAPGLCDRLSWAWTPGHMGQPGLHARYRCPEAAPLTHQVPARIWEHSHAAGRGGWRPVIETRGEGQYAVAPGTPIGCHSNSGQTWTHAGGPTLDQVQEIAAAEREVLLACARVLDEQGPAEVPDAHPADQGGGRRPGDDFNERASWAEVLEPHGWRVWREQGGLTYWTRPGKEKGVSASTGMRSRSGKDLLYVFTSSTQLPEGKALTRFGAFAHLEHGGDWAAAARALAARGYGEPRARGKGPGQAKASPPPPGRPAEGAAATPRPLPAYQPFPVQALPEVLAVLVQDAAAALGCDPSYVALPALTTCAAAIGNSRWLQIKRTWREPPVLWTCVVGESGTLKSPPYHLATEPLSVLQGRLIRRHRLDEERWTELDASGEDAGPRPQLRRVFCGDITIEKLAEVLEDSPRGVLVARDELAAWLGSFSRYKTSGSDMAGWLELHRGGRLLLDRKTGDRKQVSVERATVNVTGSIQPGTLARALTPEHYEAGLTARLLLCWPPRLPKRWSDAELDHDTADAYERLIERLLDLQMKGFDDGEEAPHLLHFSVEGRAAWVQWYNEWAQVQAQAEGELAAAYSKLEGYAARLALVHHVVSSVATGGKGLFNVEPVSVQAGCTLARWFAGEAERIYQATAESEEERASRRLLEWIAAQGGRVTARQLHRSNQRRYRSAEDAEAALDGLVALGLGAWEEVATGGRPSRQFVLCVTYDKSDKSPPDDADPCEIRPGK